MIIGGGFAGTYIARKLEKDHDVVLIDTKDYFEFTPGILRTLVEPNHAKNIHRLHESYLKRAYFVRGQVIGVTKKHVQLADISFEYDILVIASGSEYTRPFKQKNIITADRGRALRNHHNEIEEAKNILIIGGGIVGVELAAQISMRYPHKELILTHSREELIPRASSAARKKALSFLKKRNVRLILGERMQKSNGKHFTTNKGTKITADYAFLALGIQPNSQFLKGFAKLDERGFVKVENTLLMKGTNNVFVAGDVAAIAEEKLAQNAEKHATIIVENICRLAKKQALKPYLSQPRVTIISLGNYDGILSYKNWTLTGLIPGLMKSWVEKMTMHHYR